jgi:hypothetical protein
MASHGYKVFPEPDAECGGYVVVCPSIPGCFPKVKLSRKRSQISEKQSK